MKIVKSRKFNINVKKDVFTVVLQRWEKEKGYVVRVLELPQIITEGSSITEAKKMAGEAIELCLEPEADEYYPNIKSQRYSETATAVRV